MITTLYLLKLIHHIQPFIQCYFELYLLVCTEYLSVEWLLYLGGDGCLLSIHHHSFGEDQLGGIAIQENLQYIITGS